MSDEAGTDLAGEGGDAGGGEDRGWLSSIPENLREHEAIKGAESLTDIYTGFAELSDRSRDSLSIPGDDATDEDRAAFYQRLGRPEAAEQYDFTKPELPDGIPYDEAVEGAFKEIGFKHGLSQEQAAGLHAWYWSTVKAGAEEQQQKTEAEVNKLKSEDWKGDAFAENSERARRAFERFDNGDKEAAGEFLAKTVDGIAIGDHPRFLKLFAAVGAAISDDTMTGDRSHSLDAIQSADAQAKKRFPNTKWNDG